MSYSHPKLSHPDRPNESTEGKLQRLLNRSLDILESALDNSSISAEARAEIALQVLDLVEMDLVVDAEPDRDAEDEAKMNPLAAAEAQPQRVLPISSKQRHQPPSHKGAVELHATPKAIATKPTPIILPAHYVQLEDFLTDAEHDEVMQTALRRSPEFVSTTTVGDVSNYRQSSVLWGKWLPELHSMMRKKIMSHLPSVLDKLGLSSFLVSKVEMQMTAHHDGCYYKVHTDASSETTQARQLTYVYYFHREPKVYKGGELKLYETELRGKVSTSRPISKTIEPLNNSIVFFNSRCRHEVLPVSCPAEEFANGRFTLNGWVRRVDMEPVKT